MENNRSIAIYTATSRKSNVLQAWPIDIQGFFDRLRQSQTLPYTHDAYTGLKKAQQDELKEYIAGTLQDGRRKAGSCISGGTGRGQSPSPGSTEDFIRRVAGVGVCCCVHSTAKHSPASPRLRIVNGLPP